MVLLRLNAHSFPCTTEENAIFGLLDLKVIAQENLDPSTSAALLSSIDGLSVVSAKVPDDTIAKLERCRVIARYGIGVDNVDVAAATRQGIVVTNVPDFCLSEVAEHTMALLLGIARKVRVMDKATRSGAWQARVNEPVRRISGRTLGLVGFGNIARQVASRARAFELKLITCDPLFPEGMEAAPEVHSVSFNQLLEQSDFVSLHVPLTPGTYHMIGESELQRMKRDSMLINTARGALIDEVALGQALSKGWITGAALDVYEGLSMFDASDSVPDHPLLKLDNVLLSPHSAACSEESLKLLMRDGAYQACSVLAGKWPSHCVNPDVIPRVGLTAE